MFFTMENTTKQEKLRVSCSFTSSNQNTSASQTTPLKLIAELLTCIVVAHKGPYYLFW